MAEGLWSGYDCSAEEEADNLEQQNNEMDMLQSIFEGQIVVLSVGTEFMVKVTPRVDDKVILLPLAANKDMPATKEKVVTHLPDVVLYVKYPLSYPSHTSPDCHLSASWMDAQIIPFLVDFLKNMFTPSCPVVYEWIMYLQDDLVKNYNQHQCSSGAKKEKKVTTLSADTTGISVSQQPCQIFMRSTSQIHDVEEYDSFEKFREFQSEKQECGVCFNSLLGEMMCQPCGKCSFIYCKECLCSYCQSCIGDNRMVQLECPNQDCHEILPDIFLKNILPKDFFQKYVKFRDEVELDSIPGMVFCPRCKSRILSEPDSQVVVCDNEQCRFPFCRICQQTWHGLGPCPALDKVSSLRKGEAEGVEIKKELNEVEKQRRIEELQSVLWVMSNNNVRPCPNCRSHIQKNGGCNKISCLTCGEYFCWLCGEAISGYEHFNSRKSKCVLFRDEDYYPPSEDEDIKGLDTLEDIETVMNTKCPRCEKVEVKSSGNNWIHCPRCSFQYCYLCGEPCFGLYHFNEEYGCKRYTSLKEDTELMIAHKKPL